ncbi:hypothetical protein D1BOALGB6SA_5135 [Olavius sp. associated proteobacterium Delta 1]|nr:hypothetical protein D1BOALGB6SA_5135 [Olavius sp. associated proteobacterium Delta 1]
MRIPYGLKTAQTIHHRTWFRVYATVMVGPGFVHKAGVGKILIPHPPAINWLLRRGLSNKLGFKLTISHEMGHFQTAPFIVLYAIAILTSTFAAGRFNIPEVLFAMIGIQAAWEMLSEALTIVGNISYYRKCYKGIPKLPRITFWTATGMLTAGGWLIAFS